MGCSFACPSISGPLSFSIFDLELDEKSTGFGGLERGAIT
jgi:hypothetical protein